MDHRKVLINQLEDTFRAVFRQIRRDLQELFGDEINGSEFGFLKHLIENGPQKPSSLSVKLNVSASHVTNVTDALVRKGWIRRRRSSADKRVIELEITSEGIETCKRVEKNKVDYFRHKFDSLTTEEIETLQQLLQKLHKK
ncbi:MarR family winged helix-turn-helix transcriptional regulator [Melghirimyces algeriensis]|uniref:DNA-binding transcriptional regulator, MarR family n=1 Tax=Melghirimyces algeriensis TaxID=910412 RepID=A0A521AJ01_9BACL|nr:MarR family transcriptional regulator [Melghirimyces algeriensis]SMO34814.1 DNA-binding transcriptional regulator, MarR family [Melghirimyces algeriensis]